MSGCPRGVLECLSLWISLEVFLIIFCIRRSSGVFTGVPFVAWKDERNVKQQKTCKEAQLENGESHYAHQRKNGGDGGPIRSPGRRLGGVLGPLKLRPQSLERFDFLLKVLKPELLGSEVQLQIQRRSRPFEP